ncbi:MAG: AAA-like domain-containing protein [Candidatus Sumerlaeota bacterium]|nr:AAA-like domain-containing protein [Candidatus Sumerlaeota bacterium]
MRKFFNVAGPCVPGEHYMLPAQARCNALLPLIEQQMYFCIHAPRQTGKTTLLQDFVRELNASGQYHALYCSLETASVTSKVEEGIPYIINTIARYLTYFPALKDKGFKPGDGDADPNNAMNRLLSELCGKLDKPLVIMFDEADSLEGPLLISFLRQLRDGYINRSLAPFMHSVALVGMRNLRDYKGKIRPDGETFGSASPFNIITKALTLRNFTRDEIAALYAQHTEATGQVFPDKVTDAIARATCGQPWLVNAVAREVTVEILGNDPQCAIYVEHARQAIENIILRRDTHIDSLLQRLKEDRVRRVIEPILLGEDTDFDVLDDDFRYVMDLGLIKREGGVVGPANPIYGEVIVRTLNGSVQTRLETGDYPYDAPRYLEGGRLNMRKLLEEFQQFWREHSEIWVEMPLYKEAAPHLILLAFLQRIINAKGRLSREYAAGRGRMDLLVQFGEDKFPIEIKVLRRDKEKEIAKGFEQLGRYAESVGAREGWLVFFDRRSEASWDDKIFWRTFTAPDGRVLHCVGC